MRKLNYVSILLAVITVLGLTSCEENEDFQNSESKLCNQLWVEGYNIDSGDHCTHQLEFAYNGSGREVFIYQHYNTNGSLLAPYKTETFSFTWYWQNDNREGLVLKYGSNEHIYFDDVWVRNDYLSGVFDGVISTFTNSVILN
jgi:hypothetical protein